MCWSSSGSLLPGSSSRSNDVATAAAVQAIAAASSCDASLFVAPFVLRHQHNLPASSTADEEGCLTVNPCCCCVDCWMEG